MLPIVLEPEYLSSSLTSVSRDALTSAPALIMKGISALADALAAIEVDTCNLLSSANSDTFLAIVVRIFDPSETSV